MIKQKLKPMLKPKLIRKMMMMLLFIREKNCTYCNKIFRIEKYLRKLEKIQWRENRKSIILFDITSSYDHNHLYISSLDQGFIADINEAVNYVLDSIIPYKLFEYKVTANCLYKKRTPEGEQIQTKLLNLRTDEYTARTFNQDLNHLLELFK